MSICPSEMLEAKFDVFVCVYDVRNDDVRLRVDVELGET